MFALQKERGALKNPYARAGGAKKRRKKTAEKKGRKKVRPLS